MEVDSLKSKYAEDKITPEKYVELIRIYCETYNEWPTFNAVEKQIEEKTSRQLASWLRNSGYIQDEFKYGEELKLELDSLKSKYAEDIIAPEKYVELIRIYCETYNEWPKINAQKNQIQGKNGYQLTLWLRTTSGYNKGKFKYGEELKHELDELKAIYYKSKTVYDSANQSFNEDSYFQSVVESLQNGKEISNGRKVH